MLFPPLHNYVLNNVLLSVGVVILAVMKGLKCINNNKKIIIKTPLHSCTFLVFEFRMTKAEKAKKILIDHPITACSSSSL